MMDKPIDLEAYRIRKSWPEEKRQLYLHNAFCADCFRKPRHASSFAPDYVLQREGSMVIVRGKCSVCGSPMARVCD